MGTINQDLNLLKASFPGEISPKKHSREIGLTLVNFKRDIDREPNEQKKSWILIQAINDIETIFENG